MTEFAARFHLSHPEKGFDVSPWDPEDAKIYFGDQRLSRELESRIERGYSLGKPPKIYLRGGWGAGKTHHLYHLKYVVESQGVGGVQGFIAPYLQVECEDDTPFQYLHRKMLNALGLATVKEAVSDFLMSAGANRQAEQQRMFGGQNLIIATQVLSIGDDQLAWKWLSGETLSGNELRTLNVTTNLEDTTELVDVLVRLGQLLRERGKRVLFFIDEGEGIKNVGKRNAQISWHDGFRNLADNTNNSIGYIISFFVDSTHETPEFISEDDIVRRLGQRNLVDLQPYSGQDEIDPFLRDLLKSRIDFDSISSFPEEAPPDTYPFTPDARDLFINELLHGGVSATPSKIIEGVSECVWEAHIQDRNYISVEMINDVMPRVTASV
jgi:hypothetical protein